MKLYVWNRPYSVSYGGSIVYAVAESEEAARALAAVAPINCYGFGAEPRVGRRLDISGPPTAVHDLPYAEIYEWSE
jgi:hypothetical protein